MNEKLSKIKELGAKLERAVNEYPEAWTVIGVSAGVFLLRGLKKRRNKKKEILLVSATPGDLIFTNLTGKTIKYDILSDTETLKTYALHLA